MSARSFSRFMVAAAALLLPLIGVLPLSADVSVATLQLRPVVGPPTTELGVRGTGFQPGETVNVLFDGNLVSSATAGRTGKFVQMITVPGTALPGDHTVEADGLTSGFIARALFLARTDWLQACFDAGRSCYNPYENVLDTGDVGSIIINDKTQLGTGGASSPAYGDGKLYVGASDGLHALDPATFAEHWTIPTGGPVLSSPAVMKGIDVDGSGKVLFTSLDGYLYVADGRSGRLIGKVFIGPASAPPLVTYGVPDTKIIVGAGNLLTAFDGKGHRLWSTVLEGGDVSKAPVFLADPPEPEKVVVAAGNTLHAVSLADGSIQWSVAPSRTTLGAPSVDQSNVRLGGPHLLVGDQGGNLYSIDPADGTVLDTFVARAAISGSPAIGHDNGVDPYVFFGDEGGNIYAADQTDDFPPPIWEANLGAPIVGSPVLANGVLYVGTEAAPEPHLFTLDAASGRILFDTVLGGGVLSAPLVADGMVVIGLATGEVVAYGGPDTVRRGVKIVP